MVNQTVSVERTFTAMSYDIDFAGIMSNQVYQRWLEDLRTDLLYEFTDYDELGKLGVFPVLGHTEIDFKMPVKLMEKVRGRMVVDLMDDHRWILSTTFEKDGKICARARQWGVFVDAKTVKPVTAPDLFPRVRPSAPR